MITQDRYTKVYTEAKNYGQEHLLKFYETLSPKEAEDLLTELEAVNWAEMAELYRQVGVSPLLAGDAVLEPMPCTIAAELTLEERQNLEALAMGPMGQGKLAAVTMAGGQGTRLGHTGPKGTYDIGLPSHKSLFEIQCDGLQEISQRAGKTIPWYIMTSTINHEETVAFFAAHDFFGYPKDAISFFPQTMIPVMNREGKLLLEAPGKVLQSPNGNGGLFVSLKRSGMLEDMQRRGVEWVFLCGIDNCLVKMADPLFLGFVMASGKKVAAKSFLKRSPGEKAGIFCYRGGKPCVVEYTEIPKEYAELQDEHGSWVYGDTNVLNYLFTLEQIQQVAEQGLPYHTAVKKIRYFDGEYFSSPEPDSYKFELFLFDAFTYLEDLAVLRIARTEEFAPVKNAVGEDSAVLAREMFLAVHPEAK